MELDFIAGRMGLITIGTVAVGSQNARKDNNGEKRN